MMDPIDANQSDDEEESEMSEVIILTSACIVLLALTGVLFLNMRGDWTADPEVRHRVLVIAIIVFCLNVVFCCYVTRKMNVRCCRPRYHCDIESNHVLSVNEPLLSRDLPPSYAAIVSNNPTMFSPPTYEEVRSVVTPFDCTQVHHKATG